MSNVVSINSVRISGLLQAYELQVSMASTLGLAGIDDLRESCGIPVFFRIWRYA
jgi:hypothetical protein